MVRAAGLSCLGLLGLEGTLLTCWALHLLQTQPWRWGEPEGQAQSGRQHETTPSPYPRGHPTPDL